MRRLNISADELVGKLLTLAASERLCLLDSCGIGHLGSHLLIAGLRPVESFEITGDRPEVLTVIDRQLALEQLASFFTISYDFGLKLQSIESRHHAGPEPDLFAASFDCLIVHDYDSGQTNLRGNADRFDEIERLLIDAPVFTANSAIIEYAEAVSDPTGREYISRVEKIRELICQGETYQTNLTKKYRFQAGPIGPEETFLKLRNDHPAPFSAYLNRSASTVVSASPERFFSIVGDHISSSPIKGTIRRGTDTIEDAVLRDRLETSAKDIAENTMIVDLIRNDLGRVCEFGSVGVTKLCEIEEHPTLFHLVSSVTGRLGPGTPFSEILTAMFPCGSITGAPKHRTMQIIDMLESDARGLSMGAIGYRVPGSFGFEATDLSVAIRTIVFRDGLAEFNVGGGVVYDSDAASELDEAELKAKALLRALGVER